LLKHQEGIHVRPPLSKIHQGEQVVQVQETGLHLIEEEVQDSRTTGREVVPVSARTCEAHVPRLSGINGVMSG